MAGGETHGYAIAREVARRRAPELRPSTGSLYLAIGRLDANGLIEEVGVEGRRTIYSLSDLGRRVAEAETERLRALIDVAADRNLVRDPGADR